MAPSNADIRTIFEKLASTDTQASFFDSVADDVDWTVMGTHPLAGNYKSLQDFQAKTFARLSKIMKDGVKLRVRNVIGGGDQDWSVSELIAEATCLDGMVFANTYAWVCRWKGQTIVQVRAYLDSAMVKEALERNEN